MIMFLACNPDLWGSASDADQVILLVMRRNVCKHVTARVSSGCLKSLLCAFQLHVVQGLEQLCSIVRSRDTGQATEFMQSRLWSALIANIGSAAS